MPVNYLRASKLVTPGYKHIYMSYGKIGVCELQTEVFLWFIESYQSPAISKYVKHIALVFKLTKVVITQTDMPCVLPWFPLTLIFHVLVLPLKTQVMTSI